MITHPGPGLSSPRRRPGPCSPCVLQGGGGPVTGDGGPSGKGFPVPPQQPAQGSRPGAAGSTHASAGPKSLRQRAEPPASVSPPARAPSARGHRGAPGSGSSTRFWRLGRLRCGTPPRCRPLRRCGGTGSGSGFCRSWHGSGAASVPAARGSSEVSALPEQPCGDGSRAAGPRLAACQNHLRLLDLFQLPRAATGACGTPTAAAPPRGGQSGRPAGGQTDGRTEVQDLAFQEQLCN